MAQLNAIHWDLDGDGGVDDTASAADYDDAYPDAAEGMGCPESGCIGYELTADLDFDTNGNGEADAGDAYWNGSYGWSPLGGAVNEFNATFDGGGHIISNLFIAGLWRFSAGFGFEDPISRVGLFGKTDSGSHIKNIGLVGVSVSGDFGVGGLVGHNYGSITSSYVTGSVVGNRHVGGLVGSNVGPITFSYAAASVLDLPKSSAHFAAGGLAGFNGGPITSSYATGSVSSSGSHPRIGGLVGWNHIDRANNGTITNSYATGSVSVDGSAWWRPPEVGGLVGYNSSGTIRASYWDTQTSGQSTSAGGVGKTTTQMRSPTGYTGIYAGWNLDLDGDGSPDEPWDFGTSSQYPVLALKASASPPPEVPQDSLPILQAGDSDLDFDTLEAAGNTSPGGIWSNGETMWVTDWQDDKVYAYSMATRARDSAKDFNTLKSAGNNEPRELWSDEVTMWVVDADDEKIYAYSMATRVRDAAKDFNTPGAGWPAGLWSDGETMWVADWETSRIYAYNLAAKTREPSMDFDTSVAIGRSGPTGIWSDGETMWVADWKKNLIHAYDMGTRARVLSIQAAGNGHPIGIWSDGVTMWVADYGDDTIFTQSLPVAAAPTNLTAEVNEDGHVVLRWDDSDDDSITGYRVLWRDRDEDAIGQFHVLVEDTGSAETAYTDRYVTPDARYAYRVMAINALGVGDPSGPADVDVPGPPARPQGLTATVVDGKVRLTWDNPEDSSITGYRIWRRNLDVDAVGQFHIVEDDTGSAETATSTSQWSRTPATATGSRR